MNIDGIGSETVELLYQKGLIRLAPDLYDLRPEQLAPLERMGEKSAERIIQSLAASGKVPFGRVLFALGIRFVGETVAKNLATYAGSIDKLQSMTRDELVAIPEIGDRIASSVQEYFRNPVHLDMINRLKEKGINFETTGMGTSMGNGPLKGLTIVISGTFALHSREELKQMIELNGGKNGSSISKNTDYILAGENMGPSKLEKAGKLGIPLISEEQFLAMLK